MACSSGRRMLSGGYGRYENWGLRAALTPSSQENPPPQLTLDLGGGVNLDMLYIPPGSFLMGGENTKEGRFECIEVPVHPVKLTQGFYLGKYEVTQEQFQAVMGTNPSRSTKAPNAPVDNVSLDDAKAFCQKLALITKQDTRLPTEAEWEYASRAGKKTKWFFGDDPSALGDYAWYRDNADGKSHAVGQKKPTPGASTTSTATSTNGYLTPIQKTTTPKSSWLTQKAPAKEPNPTSNMKFPYQQLAHTP